MYINGQVVNTFVHILVMELWMALKYIVPDF